MTSARALGYLSCDPHIKDSVMRSVVGVLKDPVQPARVGVGVGGGGGRVVWGGVVWCGGVWGGVACNVVECGVDLRR